jgi:hypothetical protein
MVNDIGGDIVVADPYKNIKFHDARFYCLLEFLPIFHDIYDSPQRHRVHRE